MGLTADYTALLERVLTSGIKTDNRTGQATYSIFGEKLEVDVRNRRVPVINNRRINIEACEVEAKWFFDGESYLHSLEEAGCNFYRSHYMRDTKGERHVGDYIGYMLRGHRQGDQIESVKRKLEGHRSRRMVLDLHNGYGEVHSIMPSCITSIILTATSDTEIQAHITYRSCDILVGLPNDMVSMFYLVHLILDKTPYELTTMHIYMADAHIYSSQQDEATVVIAKAKEDDYAVVYHNDSIQSLMEYKSKVAPYNIYPVV